MNIADVVVALFWVTVLSAAIAVACAVLKRVRPAYQQNQALRRAQTLSLILAGSGLVFLVFGFGILLMILWIVVETGR
jgi:hypothetical protein